MPKKGKAVAAKKRNQHYVPKSRIKRFACAKGRIYAWDGQKVRHVAASKIMSEDRLYTIFDNTWRTSDVLEDALGVHLNDEGELRKRR